MGASIRLTGRGQVAPGHGIAATAQRTVRRDYRRLARRYSRGIRRPPASAEIAGMPAARSGAGAGWPPPPKHIPRMQNCELVY